ncbi:MAG: MFS transporter [Terriglobales bacterium]
MPVVRDRSLAGEPGARASGLAIHTRRQIALRLLPFVFVLYIANYLDRTSVAYAALEMSRDLGFSDRVFGMGAGIFFVGYVALQIPGALMVEHWSARRCIAIIMVAWGSLTALTGVVHTAGQLYAARLVLGAAEAGFFPGVVVYLSHWFIREDRAKATSNFMAAVPLSFIIASPMAGWIVGRHWLNVEGWRWLFILEGLPAVLLGVAAFFYLTDWPTQAHWLRPQQREWIVKTLEKEKPADVGRVTWRQALTSRQVLLLAAAAFPAYFASYAMIFWFPTILKRLSGLSNQNIGLLGAIPYLAALAAMLINGWHSDKRGERRIHAALPLFIGGIGLTGLLAWHGPLWLTVALFSMVGIVQSFLAPFWALPTEILGESAAATAVGFINAFASIAGFAGPFAFGYLNTRTGNLTAGLTVMLVCCLGSGLLLLCAPEAPKSALQGNW